MASHKGRDLTLLPTQSVEAITGVSCCPTLLPLTAPRHSRFSKYASRRHYAPEGDQPKGKQGFRTLLEFGD